MIESIIGIGLGIIVGLIVLKQRRDINHLKKMYADMQHDIKWKADSTRLQTIEAKVWEHERYVTAMCTYLNVSGVQEPAKFILKDK